MDRGMKNSRKAVSSLPKRITYRRFVYGSRYKYVADPPREVAFLSGKGSVSVESDQVGRFLLI